MDEADLDDFNNVRFIFNNKYKNELEFLEKLCKEIMLNNSEKYEYSFVYTTGELCGDVDKYYLN